MNVKINRKHLTFVIMFGYIAGGTLNIQTAAVAVGELCAADREFYDAAIEGDTLRLQQALEKGANQNVLITGWKSSRRLSDIALREMLRYQAEHGASIHCSSVVKRLIEDNANPNVKLYMPLRDSPLAYFAHEGNVELVQFMIANKADVHATDHQGHSVFFSIANHCAHAPENPNKHVIYKILKDAGVDINRENQRKQFPLQLEILSGKNSSARLLVQLGANIHQGSILNDIFNDAAKKSFAARLSDLNWNYSFEIERGACATFFELSGSPWSIDLSIKRYTVDHNERYVITGPGQEPVSCYISDQTREYLQKDLPEMRQLVVDQREKCMLMAQAIDKLFGGELQQVQLHGVYPYLGMNYPDRRSNSLQQTAAGFNRRERQKRQDLQKLSQGHLKKPHMLRFDPRIQREKDELLIARLLAGCLNDFCKKSEDNFLKRSANMALNRRSNSIRSRLTQYELKNKGSLHTHHAQRPFPIIQLLAAINQRRCVSPCLE